MNVRALFVSDVHLGTRGCQAELLLDFLNQYEADQVYLVGDIIDGWRLKSRWYWPPSHDEVVATILGKVQAGTRVVYIPGNHDAFLRTWLGTSWGGIEFIGEAIHEAVDGRRYLVLHGDRFDLVASHARWLALLGDAAYRAALVVNAWLNQARRRYGLPYWPLSAWAKLKVKKVVSFIGDFEATVVAEARRLGVQGIVCGHIHHATMRDGFGVRYINIGDWVESCSAVVEHFDGRFEIVRWPRARHDQLARSPAVGWKGHALGESVIDTVGPGAARHTRSYAITRWQSRGNCRAVCASRSA